jgi:hypothetical protein
MVGFFHCHVSFPEGEFTQAAAAVPAKDQGAHVGGDLLGGSFQGEQFTH